MTPSIPNIFPNTTPLIRSHRAFTPFNYELAVDWAIQLIQQGIETNNILMLAACSKPADSLEVIPYLTAVLNELGIEELADEAAVMAKARYHLNQIVQRHDIRKHLMELTTLCIAADYRPDLMPFYYLYYAWDELEDMGVNFYYDKVELHNINETAIIEAKTWLDQHPN